MEAIVVTALVCGTVLYVTKLFLPVFKQNADVRARTPAQQAVIIPNDLLLAASKWHDSWAREQAIRHIQELYETTGDWDKVRYVFSQQDLGSNEDS